MNVPGIKAKHARVSPTCRVNKGDYGAAKEAVNHLVSEYMELSKLPANEAANFHFILTVERPEKAVSE